MAESAAERARRVRAEGAKMRDEHNREYKQRVVDISAKWRAGFKVLKEENDRLQADLKEWHELEQDQIQNYVQENLMARGPY